MALLGERRRQYTVDTGHWSVLKVGKSQGEVEGWAFYGSIQLPHQEKKKNGLASRSNGKSLLYQHIFTLL